MHIKHIPIHSWTTKTKRTQRRLIGVVKEELVTFSSWVWVYWPNEDGRTCQSSAEGLWIEWSSSLWGQSASHGSKALRLHPFSMALSLKLPLILAFCYFLFTYRALSFCNFIFKILNAILLILFEHTVGFLLSKFMFENFEFLIFFIFLRLIGFFFAEAMWRLRRLLATSLFTTSPRSLNFFFFFSLTFLKI